MESESEHLISRRVLPEDNDSTQSSPLSPGSEDQKTTLQQLDSGIVVAALLTATFLLLFAILVSGMILLLRKYCCSVFAGFKGSGYETFSQTVLSKAELPKSWPYGIPQLPSIEPRTTDRLDRIRPLRSNSVDTVLPTPPPPMALLSLLATPRQWSHDEATNGQRLLQEQQQQQQQEQPKSKNGSPLSTSLPDIGVSGGQGQGQGQGQGLIGVDTAKDSDKPAVRILFSVTVSPSPSSATDPCEIFVYIDRIEHQSTVRAPCALGDERETFILAYLLPLEESHMIRTKSVHNRRDSRTINFNEDIKFEVAAAAAAAGGEGDCPTHLRLSVYEVDAKRLRHTVGHVIVPLDLGSDGALLCKELDSDDILLSYQSNGEMRITLTYDPDAASIGIKLVEARYLTRMTADSEHCVLVQMLRGGQILTSKTSDKQTCLSPSGQNYFRYEKRFKFPLPVALLDDVSIRVTVTTFDRGGQVEVTGSPGRGLDCGVVTLGSHKYSRGDGLDHWVDSITRPFEMVSRWHRLAKPSRGRGRVQSLSESNGDPR